MPWTKSFAGRCCRTCQLQRRGFPGVCQLAGFTTTSILLSSISPACHVSRAFAPREARHNQENNGRLNTLQGRPTRNKRSKSWMCRDSFRVHLWLAACRAYPPYLPGGPEAAGLFCVRGNPTADREGSDVLVARLAASAAPCPDGPINVGRPCIMPYLDCVYNIELTAPDSADCLGVITA